MTHEGVLKDRYFRWLCEFTHTACEEGLLRQLHDTPFIWVVPNDVNRAEDGRELRDSLLDDHGITLNDRDKLFEADASVLEVLAALAERASFQSERSIEEWFSIFLENLGLLEFCLIEDTSERVVDDILNNWMLRNYSTSGTGGLFPLTNPPENQRLMELWYQMSVYIQEDMEADGFFD